MARVFSLVFFRKITDVFDIDLTDMDMDITEETNTYINERVGRNEDFSAISFMRNKVFEKHQCDHRHLHGYNLIAQRGRGHYFQLAVDSKFFGSARTLWEYPKFSVPKYSPKIFKPLLVGMAYVNKEEFRYAHYDKSNDLNFNDQMDFTLYEELKEINNSIEMQYLNLDME